MLNLSYETAEGWRPPTEAEFAKMVEYAYQMGLDGDEYDEESRTIDWDRILSGFEGAAFSEDFTQIELGSDMDAPIIKAIQRAYRRGRKDQTF